MTTVAAFSMTAAERARIEHIDQLVVLGGAAVDELIAALSERSWTVRRAVVAALAALGDEAVGPLCAWLETVRSSEHAIAAAVDALAGSVGETATADVLALARRAHGAVLEDAARILGRRRSFEAVPLLRDLLSHADDNVAMSAIEALGAIGGSASIDALVALIESRNFFRTFPAMQVAARSGDPRVIGPLAALLHDETYRFEAARALGRTGSPLAIAPLAAMLSGADAATVRLVASALDELWSRATWSGAVEHVLETLQVRLAGTAEAFGGALAGGELAERLAVVRVLGAIGGVDAIDVLAPLLGSAELRTAASEAIQRLARAEPAALTRAFDSPDAEVRAVALTVVGSARSAPAVRKLLTDEDAEVRARACDALARIGDTGAVRALFTTLGDANPRVAHAAAAAIQSLGTAETPELALAALASSSPNLRRQALRIMAYLGHERAFDVVCAATGDPDLRIAELAVGALAALSDPRVDGVLAELARSPREGLRAAVMRAAGHRESDAMYALLELGVADDAAWVRYYACQGLGRAARVTATPRLMDRLADATPHVRVAAIEALARLDTPHSWQLLMSLARSRDPDEQRAALVGIGQHTEPAAVTLLADAAESPDIATRLIALAGLARSRTALAHERLARAARDPVPEIRDAAVSLLAERDDAESAAILATLALSTPPEHPAHAAISRPSAVRIAEIVSRLASAREGDITVLTSALARMRSDDATRALFEALVSPSASVRRDAATALVGSGAAGAVAAVRKLAAEDPDPEVRRACAAAVAS